MTVDTNIYDKKFFDNTLEFESDSSRAAVDILIKYFHPNSVIDIGCGIGIYLKEFKNKNIDILGYDGSPEAINGSLVGDYIVLHDLSYPLDLNRKFDLCLCIEVAEHLPETSADTLINTLVKFSPTIFFTAATPGQGDKNIGHINEQPHLYWVEKFKSKNYILNEKLTAKIKKEMGESKVVWWITKNLMIFNKILF